MDTCWNMAIRHGTRPIVTAHCTCAQLRHHGCGVNRPKVTYMITATAPNESQKPGASTHMGSTITVISTASASTCAGHAARPSSSASATTPSMYTVRCAGTANPASNAYDSAVMKPATAAALTAASLASNAAERLQSASTMEKTSPDTIVICSPE